MKFDKKTAEDILKGKLYGEILKNGKPIEIEVPKNGNLIVGYEDINGIMTPFIFDANNCPEITIIITGFLTFDKGDVIMIDDLISVVSEQHKNGIDTFITLDYNQKDSWADHYHPGFITGSKTPRKATPEEIVNLKNKIKNKINYLNKILSICDGK